MKRLLLMCLFLLVCGCASMPRQYNPTKISHLEECEYPDTVKVLIDHSQRKQTVGKFARLNYRMISDINYVYQNWLYVWEEKEFLTFVKEK